MSSVAKGIIVCEEINKYFETPKNTWTSDSAVFFIIFSTQIALKKEVNVSVSWENVGFDFQPALR